PAPRTRPRARGSARSRSRAAARRSRTRPARGAGYRRVRDRGSYRAHRMTSPEDIDAQLLGPGGPFEVGEADVFGERMTVFKSRVRSLRDLLVGARNFGDAEYFAFTDGNDWRRFTFAEHERLVASTAAVLRDE